MSGNSTTATELTSQYSAQVTADLERNRKEQDRVAGEIEALQAQLTALRHDRTVLENIQRALGSAQEPVAAPEEDEPVAVVPAPRAQEPRTTRRTKAAGTGKRGKETRPAEPAKGKGTGKRTGTASRRRAGAKSASRDTAPKSTARTADETVEAAASSSASSPSLVELVRGHLAERQEPRSAAEVASALAERYPERGVKATVVRSTLEGLVARNQAHRSKQGRSVFYTVPDASAPDGPSAAERSPEDSD